MVKGNFYFNRLKRAYIFPIIEEKTKELKTSFPDADIVNMGIGDVAFPLAPSIAKAIAEATLEMSEGKTLYGYGPSEGYLFLRKAICSNVYKNLPISPEEIFISDGINTDIVNILDLFHPSCSVAIPDPAYPAYLDSNLLQGRKKNIHTMPCSLKTNFIPTLPNHHCDILYLCSPHNPTGIAMNKEQLKSFVDYALEHDSIILFDSAYEAFITSPNTPKSIYEIPNAEKVAIEFRSFSKTAGFTGLRCSYTSLPKEIKARFGKKTLSLHALWKNRQSIKFNGVAYPIQKGAEACFSPQGKEEIETQIQSYLEQARWLKEGLIKAGQQCFGGTDSPYIWWKAPKEMSSWDFFTFLLNKCHLISIPGVGFGKEGEGYVRLSAFSKIEKTKKALERITKLV
ncbi:MAG: LL-diaminopimelate aminotransferase [Verrucomicrobia bacterium]|nr:LL-diaminopimelate aminotransferase [Verrucomicrobiota bacterium]